MRSVVYNAFGVPAEVLHLAERPVPDPGPGEIRVRMVLSPVHNHDLWTIRGEYGVKPVLPAIGGTEALGVVDKLGEGLTTPALGQRVTAGSAVSTWAEYFLARAATVIPVPVTISDDVACQLTAMPLSAMMALEELGVQPGQWMIQNAATGAVGKTLAMIAKARGVHVVNIVRRRAGVAELAALGIDNAISTTRIRLAEARQGDDGRSADNRRARLDRRRGKRTIAADAWRRRPTHVLRRYGRPTDDHNPRRSHF